MSDRLFAIEVWLQGELAYTNFDTDLEGAKGVARAIVRDEGQSWPQTEVRVYEMTHLATYGTGVEAT